VVVTGNGTTIANEELMIRKICLILALTTPATLAVPIVTNGSLTGPIANSTVPSGWTIYSPSPDTNAINAAAGSTSLSYAIPATNSPDGGTWVGLADNGGNGFSEIFGQTVGGFTPGNTYSISWDVAHFGFQSGYTAADAIGVTVNGSNIGSGSVHAVGPGWTHESLQFVASGASQDIRFGLAQNAGSSYLQMDGISISEVSSAVPESGTTLALFGLSLVGLGFGRRFFG
jgi:hypothetical protein